MCNNRLLSVDKQQHWDYCFPCMSAIWQGTFFVIYLLKWRNVPIGMIQYLQILSADQCKLCWWFISKIRILNANGNWIFKNISSASTDFRWIERQLLGWVLKFLRLEFGAIRDTNGCLKVRPLHSSVSHIVETTLNLIIVWWLNCSVPTHKAQRNEEFHLPR